MKKKRLLSKKILVCSYAGVIIISWCAHEYRIYLYFPFLYSCFALRTSSATHCERKIRNFFCSPTNLHSPLSICSLSKKFWEICIICLRCYTIQNQRRSVSHWLMSHVPIPVNYLIFWHTFPHSTVQIAASGAVLCSYRLYNLRLCIRTLSLYETDICRIISSYSARDRQMLWQCNHAAICAASLYHSIRWKTILGFTNCTTNIWSVHA